MREAPLAPQGPRPQAERFETAPAEFETAPQTPSNARAGATGQNGHNGKQRPLVSKTFQAHERGAAGGKSFNYKRTYHIAHGLTPSLEIC